MFGAQFKRGKNKEKIFTIKKNVNKLSSTMMVHALVYCSTHSTRMKIYFTKILVDIMIKI